MAAFTIVIAIAAILQWREMVEQNQTDSLVDYAKKQSVAAGSISGAAQQFSDTAKDTNNAIHGGVDQLQAAVKNAQVSFRGDQRAWLGIENVVGFPAKGQPFIVTAYLKNTGKTPATNIAGLETFWK